jgi:hypothetical protein
MAAILESFSGQTGLSLYVQIRNAAGAVWNGSSFVTWNSANWSTYSIAMTEQTDSGYYTVAFPSSIAAGKYTFVVYQRLGGSAAIGDQPMGVASIFWDGTSEIDFNALTAGQKTDVGAQVTSVFNTAIPGSPTTNSPYERIKAIDDKLPGGAISGFDPLVDSINLGANQSGVTIGTVNSLGAPAQSQVNDQVLDVLGTDTVPELASLPTATPTMRQILMLLYMAMRNKRTASLTEEKIYNAAGSAIATAIISDSGVQFTKENFA